MGDREMSNQGSSETSVSSPVLEESLPIPTSAEVSSELTAQGAGVVDEPGHETGAGFSQTSTAPTAPPPSNDVAVDISHLSKVYGDLRAVDDFSLQVPKGSIFGLIGPNGAGKSTTFAVLATMLKPTSGKATVFGVDPSKKPKDVRRLMGYMPDVLGLYDGLDAAGYLDFFASAYRIPRKKRADLTESLLQLVDLDGKAKTQVSQLSRGMKQRLSLARALIHDPQLLILDEPASGLDPRARVELRDLIRQLSGMGKTILVSSHILSELQDLCTDVAILEAGKLRAVGPVETIAWGTGERVVSVIFADGSRETHTLGSDEEQAELLRKLIVEDGRAVLSFRSDAGLERAFMTMTEGIVQ